MTKEQQMIKQAQAIMANAYSPYSQFQVGACFAAEDGSLYSGCNVENASYGGTLCAQAGALSALIGAGKQRIEAIELCSSSETSVVPCGICLQRISEFASPNTPIHVSNRSGVSSTMTLQDLFPRSFSQHHMENNQ